MLPISNLQIAKQLIAHVVDDASLDASHNEQEENEDSCWWRRGPLREGRGWRRRGLLAC